MVAYQETQSAFSTPQFPRADEPSEFVIVATEDGTNVTLTPSCASLSGSPSGVSINLVMNRGETYQYQCDGLTDDVFGAVFGQTDAHQIAGFEFWKQRCCVLGDAA